MADGAAELLEAARKRAYATPLKKIDVSDPALFQSDTVWPYFERLRREDPVHFTGRSPFGPHWSITRYDDIMAVDANHEAFSSADGVTIVGAPPAGLPFPMFIAMDPPKHDAQRKVVSPIFSSASLAGLEGLIRERAGTILDGLPIGETFDWVDRVSVELTTQMLAVLFDFPFEDRRRLTFWSDVATAPPGTPMAPTFAYKREVLMECLGYFMRLWNERVNAPEPGADLISMLAQGEATRDMPPMEYLGNLILLIVGGNDTTRNTITGSLLALNQNPDQYAKLRADPGLIPSMVSESIRWQTPVMHARRTAAKDVRLGGKTIRRGDKVIMWYASGNRDETAIDRPDAFVIDRDQPRRHLSFGFGIHRCVGNRLAEMQLRVVWEEILKRWSHIEVAGEPRRVFSNLIRGVQSMPARIVG